MEFGMDLKELHIVRSNLNTIKSHAFMHVRGIKYLDFSENTIGTIEDDAFSEVTKSENIFFCYFENCLQLKVEMKLMPSRFLILSFFSRSAIL